MKDPVHKIGIICAVVEECGLLAKALRNKKRRTAGPVTIIDGTISGIRTAIVIAGIGKVNAAIGTMALIYDVKPDAIINIGIAGCYDGSGLVKGDVALADKEIYADVGVSYGKRFKDMKEIGIPVLKYNKRAYFNEFPSDKTLLSMMKKSLKIIDKNLAIGPFLTVSSVSGSKERAGVLRRRFHGVCENMEGAAVYHVAHMFNMPCMAIRGISNVAGVRNKRSWKIMDASELCQSAVITCLEDM